MTGPFCAQCGEKRLTPGNFSLRPLIDEAVGEFVHFDGRLLRTIKTLLSRPGELARAYFHGGRSRYTKPLTLFVIINVVFFVFQPHTGLLRYGYSQYVYPGIHSGTRQARLVEAKLRRTGEEEAAYRSRFDAVLQDEKKSLLIFSIPVIAALMLVLFLGTGRKIAEHLVFAVHLYAFILVYITAIVLAFAPILFVLEQFGRGMHRVAVVLSNEAAISVLMLVGITSYAYFAARRAYGLSGPLLLLRALVIAFSVGYLTGIYRNVVFYATLWST